MDIIAGDDFLRACDQKGSRGGAVGWGTLLQVAGSNPDGFTRIFHWHSPFRLQYKPGVEWAFHWYEYQEYFLVVKTAVV